jgi:hypothetical protein
LHEKAYSKMAVMAAILDIVGVQILIGPGEQEIFHPEPVMFG